jgi:hypothetical protein
MARDKAYTFVAARLGRSKNRASANPTIVRSALIEQNLFDINCQFEEIELCNRASSKTLHQIDKA